MRHALLLFLLFALGTEARADFFNFAGNPGKDNPLDSNEGGAAVSTGLNGTQAGLAHGANQAHASAWRTFKGGGSADSIGRQLILRDSLKGGARIIEKAGPAVDHLPWMATAAGEISTGHFSQGMFTAINGIAKAAASGIGAAVGASVGSTGGPAGTVAGGVGGGYAVSEAYDGSAGRLFDRIKSNLARREDATQMQGMATDKMDLGPNPQKKLAETHARYLQFVKDRKEWEKAEADRKIAEAATAAEMAKKQAEMAKQKDAAAQQKVEADAARQRLKNVVASSKWTSSADLACTKFSISISGKVTYDSTGHERKADDGREVRSKKLELEIKRVEKNGADCFLIHGRSFDHELRREKEWNGMTGVYQIHGILANDLKTITSLTVSWSLEPYQLKEKDSYTHAEYVVREGEKSWSVTIVNIPETTGTDADTHAEGEHFYHLNLAPAELPKGCGVSQSRFIDRDTLYLYERLHDTAKRDPVRAAIHTDAGPWGNNQPDANIYINIALKKRKGM